MFYHKPTDAVVPHNSRGRSPARVGGNGRKRFARRIARLERRIPMKARHILPALAGCLRGMCIHKRLSFTTPLVYFSPGPAQGATH